MFKFLVLVSFAWAVARGFTLLANGVERGVFELANHGEHRDLEELQAAEDEEVAGGLALLANGAERGGFKLTNPGEPQDLCAVAEDEYCRQRYQGSEGGGGRGETPLDSEDMVLGAGEEEDLGAMVTENWEQGEAEQEEEDNRRPLEDAGEGVDVFVLGKDEPLSAAILSEVFKAPPTTTSFAYSGVSFDQPQSLSPLPPPSPQSPPEAVTQFPQNLTSPPLPLVTPPQSVLPVFQNVTSPPQNLTPPPQNLTPPPPQNLTPPPPQNLTPPPPQNLTPPPPQNLTPPPQNLTPPPPQNLTPPPPQNLTPPPPQNLTPPPPQNLTPPPPQNLTPPPPQNLTPPPQNLTPPPQNLTPPPQNLTPSPPQNLTPSPPQNLTPPPPQNLTPSPPQNLTPSPPQNVTPSPPQNVTSPPQNVTSPPQNVTSPPQNVTSPPQNMTSPPQNVTSPPQNVTSPPQNVTSPSQNTTLSTPQNTTTPPPQNLTSPSTPSNLTSRLSPITTFFPFMSPHPKPPVESHSPDPTLNNYPFPLSSDNPNQTPDAWKGRGRERMGRGQIVGNCGPYQREGCERVQGYNRGVCGKCNEDENDQGRMEVSESSQIRDRSGKEATAEMANDAGWGGGKTRGCNREAGGGCDACEGRQSQGEWMRDSDGALCDGEGIEKANIADWGEKATLRCNGGTCRSNRQHSCGCTQTPARPHAENDATPCFSCARALTSADGPSCDCPCHGSQHPHCSQA